jgi:hypothetical protein
MQILINRGGLFRVRPRVWRSRWGNTLAGTPRLRTGGNLFFNSTWKERRLGGRIFDERPTANLDSKPFAFQLEICESVRGDQVDQLAEFAHINRSFEMSWLIALSPPSTITRSALRRLVRL